MGKMAREVLEKAGLNVDKLLDMLIRAAAAEFLSLIHI